MTSNAQTLGSAELCSPRDCSLRKELRAHVLRAEQASQRLAFDLHDGVMQSLCAAMLQLTHVNAAVDAGVRSDLDTVLALLEHCADDVAVVMRELRPHAVDAEGLARKAYAYVDELKEYSGFEVKVRVDGQDPGLSSDAQMALFRIVQESLTNARKHSGETCARLSLTFSPTEVTCEIADDGDGFDALSDHPRDRPAIGLIAIQERAAMLGGTATITSSPGAGTIVTASVPL